MTKTQSGPEQDSVVSEIEIATPPERVFQALINREQALQWGSSDAFEITVWEMDAHPGGRWEFTSHEKGSTKEFKHHGEVIEVDPPRALAYTWFANWHEDPSHRTLVRWELTPTPTGTRVKVTHSGLAQLPSARTAYGQGWSGLLQALKKFSEK